MSESKTPFEKANAKPEVQRWTGAVSANDGGGFVTYGDYLDVWRKVQRQFDSLDGLEHRARKAESDLAAALAERDALAARVEKAEADARRWRFVRGKVSRILNERTLKMDGLRVEVYYDEPQAFLIVPTDNGALFDEAIDAGMSREEKS